MALHSSSHKPSLLELGIAVPTPSKPHQPFLPGLAPAYNLYNRFAQWRTALGLPNPGNAENLQKEVKSTHLTNFMFDGARADLSKTVSANPGFQVSHSFNLASQTTEPGYNFAAVFAGDKTFMHGSVDHEGNVSGRFHHTWTPSNTSKVQIQLGSDAERSVVHLEHDYAGLDYNANIKGINISPIDATGIYIGSYLQSITKNVALGVESLYQRAPDGEDLVSTYLLKYTSSAQNWIATAQVQPAGSIHASYWQKLSEKVDVAADLQLIAAPMRRDAVATVGAKWDLRMATFRAQLDSTGKVSALLEQKFAPSFSFLVSGEIDHFKNSAKVGVGVIVDSSTLTPEEMGLPPQY